MNLAGGIEESVTRFLLPAITSRSILFTATLAPAWWKQLTRDPNCRYIGHNTTTNHTLPEWHIPIRPAHLHHLGLPRSVTPYHMPRSYALAHTNPTVTHGIWHSRGQCHRSDLASASRTHENNTPRKRDLKKHQTPTSCPPLSSS
jgi:hypothetical protein